MNYYNPYYMMPVSNMVRPSLFGSLTRGINWSSILNGAQRTLGVVNQALPLIKQAAPMVRNAKTMFKVMNEFKKIDNPKTTKIEKRTNNFTQKNNLVHENNLVSDTGPTFFL